MILYFVRHGESEANLLQEFSNRGLKHGLTEKGRQQAEALAKKLRPAGITHLYTSPLLRAVQTTEILSNALGLPFTPDEALREYDVGVLEGRSDPQSWRLFRQVLDGWLAGRGREQGLPEGESFEDIRRRFAPFIERLVKHHGGQPGGIVLIGHGGLFLCMLPLLLSNVDVNFATSHPLGHTGLVAAEPRSEGLVCLTWGETRLA